MRSYSATLLAVVHVDDGGNVRVDVPLGALTAALEAPVANIDPERFAHDVVAVQAAVRKHRPAGMSAVLGREFRVRELG